MSLHDKVDVRSFAKYAQGRFGRLLAAPTTGWIVAQASALDSALEIVLLHNVRAVICFSLLWWEMTAGIADEGAPRGW
jgi:hypothetical protein